MKFPTTMISTVTSAIITFTSEHAGLVVDAGTSTSLKQYEGKHTHGLSSCLNTAKWKPYKANRNPSEKELAFIDMFAGILGVDPEEMKQSYDGFLKTGEVNTSLSHTASTQPKPEPEPEPESIDWSNPNQIKYMAYYDHEKGCFAIGASSTQQAEGTRYFVTPEEVQQYIDENTKG